MKPRTIAALRIVSIVLGFSFVSGCPLGTGQHVAWLINGTVNTTYTEFIYDNTGGMKTVELDSPLEPGSAQRFVFDDAFRASVVAMGLKSSNQSFALLNDGTFGYGGTDFVMGVEVSNVIQGKWIKEPS